MKCGLVDILLSGPRAIVAILHEIGRRGGGESGTCAMKPVTPKASPISDRIGNRKQIVASRLWPPEPPSWIVSGAIDRYCAMREANISLYGEHPDKLDIVCHTLKTEQIGPNTFRITAHFRAREKTDPPMALVG